MDQLFQIDKSAVFDNINIPKKKLVQVGKKKVQKRKPQIKHNKRTLKRVKGGLKTIKQAVVKPRKRNKSSTASKAKGNTTKRGQRKEKL